MGQDNATPDPPAMAAPISATPDTAGQQATTSASSENGILFLELYDEDGSNLLAGKSYKIVGATGGKTFSGTVGDDGRLHHDDVPPDDYVLTVDGISETTAALVLDTRDGDPQVLFLAGGAS